MLQLESSVHVRKGLMLLNETQSKFVVAMENFNKCSMKCDVNNFVFDYDYFCHAFSR